MRHILLLTARRHTQDEGGERMVFHREGSRAPGLGIGDFLCDFRSSSVDNT